MEPEENVYREVFPDSQIYMMFPMLDTFWATINAEPGPLGSYSPTGFPPKAATKVAFPWTIPAEIHAHILSFLGWEDQLNCALASPLWHAILRSHSKTLDNGDRYQPWIRIQKFPIHAAQGMMFKSVDNSTLIKHHNLLACRFCEILITNDRFVSMSFYPNQPDERTRYNLSKPVHNLDPNTSEAGCYILDDPFYIVKTTTGYTGPSVYNICISFHPDHFQPAGNVNVVYDVYITGDCLANQEQNIEKSNTARYGDATTNGKKLLYELSMQLETYHYRGPTLRNMLRAVAEGIIATKRQNSPAKYSKTIRAIVDTQSICINDGFKVMVEVLQVDGRPENYSQPEAYTSPGRSLQCKDALRINI
ncbi:hypothetical protein TWF694_005102 [Orbilia ellipsospora]|uniref:F-box domain-containing protein n=1 Tax=Orbilia ellipsospora TaxID=2528407 RepID=A0AAV9WW63_9PEZI